MVGNEDEIKTLFLVITHSMKMSRNIMAIKILKEFKSRETTYQFNIARYMKTRSIKFESETHVFM